MQQPLDGSIRRRIYLMRHAEADYASLRHAPRPDPRQVPLTARGREEAQAMRDLLAALPLDRALCSGLARTRETAEIVLEKHALSLGEDLRLEEVRREGRAGAIAPADFALALAYAFSDADRPDAAFLGGERLADLDRRVRDSIESLAADGSWRHLLVVAHGGVNRVVLAWALDTGLGAMARLEQDSACLNVIDLDSDPESGALRRTIVRLLNLTPGDLTKTSHWLTTLERQALLFSAGGA